jgi:hypothetical protein
LKIRSVRADPRRRAFAVTTAHDTYELPWSQLDVVPSHADPVVHAAPDPETGREAFTYRLASGAEDSVLLDQVLWFASDPDVRHEHLLHELTCSAIDSFAASGRTKRSVARQLRTSLAQIARILDPANRRKSIDQLVRFHAAVGRTIDFRVRRASQGRSRARARLGS